MHAWAILIVGCFLNQHCAAWMPQTFAWAMAPIWTVGTLVIILIMEMSSIFLEDSIVDRTELEIGKPDT